MARQLSTRGMRWAYLFGLLLAFFLPKRVDCGYPDAGPCERRLELGLVCHDYEVEPWGFYALERLATRDIGFAYSHDEDCR
ncbi:MAG: hypothetical protein IPI49_00450 [Myxococcales bacterium]|jgi:hypothetical protein|nr:hypothetical protein [Myxococcales bacterium]HRC58042.1 hypothetical protein [Kofleriaceae bacterium]